MAIAVAADRGDAQQLPGRVYISPLGTGSENVMMSSIAGIANRVTQGEVLISRDEGDLRNPRFWLDQLKLAHPQVQSEVRDDPSFFIDRYDNLISGYVLYDRAVDPHSVNMATSISGVTNAIVVDPSTLHYATDAGLTQVADARGMTYDEVYEKYRTRFNRDMIFHMTPDREEQLRDFAIMNRGFMYYSDPTSLGAYAEDLNNQGRVFGWGSSEYEFFEEVSRNNLQAVPSTWSWSNSTTARWELPPPKQLTHASPSATAEPGKHYVAFVMSDGDNAQWITNDFPTDEKWYGSPHRGNFDMTWDLTPSLAEMSPIALQHLYENASTGEHEDQFVSPGGSGLIFPSQYPDAGGLAQSITQSLHDADQRVVSILDPVYDGPKLHTLLDESDVLGLMFKTYSDNYKGRDGAIEIHNGKPIVSVKYSLWDGADNALSIAQDLNATTHRDPHNDIDSYTIVNVHPWSVTGPNGTGVGDPMSNLNQLVEWLDPQSVEVVTLEELMVHLRNNFGDPVALHGDFNDDGVIDAADYTTWRDTMASGANHLVNDPTPGAVDLTDYEFWKAHFGETAAATVSGGVTAGHVTPEPSSIVLQAMAALFLCHGRRGSPKPTIADATSTK